jgi:hypothetical protein
LHSSAHYLIKSPIHDTIPEWPASESQGLFSVSNEPSQTCVKVAPSARKDCSLRHPHRLCPSPDPVTI